MNETIFEKGTIYINGRSLKTINEILWDRHPKFDGVFTKNLFTGADSGNNINAMIVKIEPYHEIGDHLHPGKAELHEVISGGGEASVDSIIIGYSPGVVSFIAGDISHNVKAGGEGMILLAKFTPPLN